ncbi:hypothetical protein J3F83DRAFT_725836 [Trichoderma novae-zelandiae]
MGRLLRVLSCRLAILDKAPWLTNAMLITVGIFVPVDCKDLLYVCSLAPSFILYPHGNSGFPLVDTLCLIFSILFIKVRAFTYSGCRPLQPRLYYYEYYFAGLKRHPSNHQAAASPQFPHRPSPVLQVCSWLLRRKPIMSIHPPTFSPKSLL